MSLFNATFIRAKLHERSSLISCYTEAIFTFSQIFGNISRCLVISSITTKFSKQNKTINKQTMKPSNTNYLCQVAYSEGWEIHAVI